MGKICLVTRHRPVHCWWVAKIEIRTEATELKINRPQCKVPSSLLLSNYPFSTQTKCSVVFSKRFRIMGSDKKTTHQVFPDKIRWSWKQETSLIFSKLSLKMRNCRFSHQKMIKCDTKIVTNHFLRFICRITPKRNTCNRCLPSRMDSEKSHIESERQQ